MGIKHIVLVIKTEAEEEFKDGNEEVTGEKKKRSAVGKFSHITQRKDYTTTLENGSRSICQII